MQEAEVSLGALSAIGCRFTLRTYSEEEDGFYCPVLIAAFDGEYRHGARGNDDAVYLTAMLSAAVSAWHPLALVLDFKDLTYTWGDMMDSPLRFGEEHRHWEGGLATTVVASSRNEPALRSLIDALMGDDPDDWLCPTREAAIAKVLERRKAQLAAIQSR